MWFCWLPCEEAHIIIREIARVGSRILSFYYRLTGYLGVALVVFIMLVVTAEVSVRLIANSSIIFAVDLSSWSLVVMVFLGVAWVLQKGSHITVDIAVVKLKGRARRVVDTLALSIAAAVCAFVTHRTLLYSLNLLARGDWTDYPLQFHKGFLTMVMPVGFFFLTLQFLIHAWRRARARETDSVAEEASKATTRG